ncbi:MAG TPA: ribosome biogenesis GTPase Der [Alphaproteobacteria bacterium]|nr:ribosome biogenesis GTPase Der [Alphaproteobacteria bacterium]
MKTLVALVGRPNAGKSTLFNTLAKGQRALVHATPGTTRDSRRCPAYLDDLEFDLLDTAGIDENVKGEGLDADLTRNLTRLAQRSAGQADVLVYLVDGDAGVLPADRALVQQLRKLGKPMVLVLSKADIKRAMAQRQSCMSLGLGEPIALSAAHRINFDHLRDALAPLVSRPEPEPEDEVEAFDFEMPDNAEDLLEHDEAPRFKIDNRPINIALLGQPNAGKSTLANRLLGGERMLAGPMPGLTREALSHPLNYGGQKYMLTDTPGLRRKAKITDDLEHWSVGQAVNAGQDADVAVLLVDASHYAPGNWQVLENQDKKIAQTLVTAGRPLIVALTKWDSVEAKQDCLEEVKHQMRRVLTEIPRPLCVPLSAHNGQGVGSLMKAVAAVHMANHGDLGTRAINRAIEKVTARRSPPLGTTGMVVTMKFARQVGANPPTIAIWGNRLATLPNSYKQFMRNMLAEELDLSGVPLRLVFRAGGNPFTRGETRNKKK